jgi:hypothetical protein
MNETILNWIKVNNLRKKEYVFLLKGYINFKNKESNNIKRIVSTFPSDVRPLKERKLLKPNDIERRKKENWYDFTKKGFDLTNKLKDVPVNELNRFLVNQ